MKEYIEREAASRVLCDACGNAACPKGLIPRCSYYEKMQSIPAADVVEVRHGRWIDMGDFISCSVCNATRMKEFLCDYGVARRLDVRTNYCPACGARMDGGVNA